MSPEETIGVCFCGPAKSTALGIPLLYAMWQPVDLFLKAKTSVPVLLYTTEQICVAHFFVQLFRWWQARIVEKEDLDDTGDDVEIGMAENSRGNHAGRGHERTTV
jgi:sodium/bile acid cotransporter 7